MLFKSKVDWWFYVAIAIVPLSLTATLLPLVLAGQVSLLMLGVFLAISGFPIWLLVATHYQIANDNLHIKSGPFSWDVPVSEIQAVKPSRSLMSSPALSIDRLELRYSNGRSILVSPLEKAKFLEAIGHPEPLR